MRKTYKFVGTIVAAGVVLVGVALPASAVDGSWSSNTTWQSWQVEPGAVSHKQSLTLAEATNDNEFVNVGIRAKYIVLGTTYTDTTRWGQYYASTTHDKTSSHRPSWVWR